MNLTLGQYYPVNSPVHSLDARTKILATMLYITGLFMAADALSYAVALLLLIVAMWASAVPLRLMLSGLKGIMFIIVFTLVLNLFFTRTGYVIFALGPLKITNEGLLLSVKIAVRLVMLIIASSIMTLTTSPIELTVGMEYLLSPFKKIGLPAHEIAMMMSIALRFIPTLVEEADKIKKAQTARGAAFDSGNMAERAKSLLPLLVPLFVSAFRRADELAMAMEARCYRGDVNRTRMNEPRLRPGDVAVLLTFGLFAAAALVLRLLWRQ